MNWNTELAFLITPKSGPMRAMETLLDANRAIIDDVPTVDRARAHWIRAKRAILKAAETASDQHVRKATGALLNAIIAEGWLAYRREGAPNKNAPACEEQPGQCVGRKSNSKSNHLQELKIPQPAVRRR